MGTEFFVHVALSADQKEWLALEKIRYKKEGKASTEAAIIRDLIDAAMQKED